LHIVCCISVFEYLCFDCELFSFVSIRSTHFLIAERTTQAQSQTELNEVDVT